MFTFFKSITGLSRPVMGFKKGKVNPLQVLRVPGVSGSRISRQSAQESGKVVSPTHRPYLPLLEIFLVLISGRS